MYRNCIFCSSNLGHNEEIETFPVGSKLAFDAWKGRLWAICPRCSRWNLSPLEERWESVEECEKRFRDARLRVQSENIGLARLPGGTRLIRIGEALPGELAAWRYGGQLIQRRHKYLVAAGVVGAAFLTAGYGMVALGGSMGIWGGAYGAWSDWQQRKVVHRIPASLSASGKETLIRRWHLQGARLAARTPGEVELHLRDVQRKKQKKNWMGQIKFSDAPPVVLTGVDARVTLGRAMVHVNRKGATKRRVQDAVGLLSQQGSADTYLHRIARQGSTLATPKHAPAAGLAPAEALALEMALHEETERRAMEGELTLLESAWREAEEIAAIADSLS